MVVVTPDDNYCTTTGYDQHYTDFPVTTSNFFDVLSIEEDSPSTEEPGDCISPAETNSTCGNVQAAQSGINDPQDNTNNTGHFTEFIMSDPLPKSTVPPSWFKEKGLKSACLNINRLMGKLDQVKLCLNEQKPDIFGLCETFLTDKVDEKMIQHDGYVLERRDRVDKSGGGILCFVKDELGYKRRLDLEDETIEIVWLEVVYACSRNILIGFVYRPPNSTISWFNAFSANLEKAYLEAKEIILMGDMNVDLSKCVNQSSNVKKLVHILDSVKLTQIICDPTRVASHSTTLIDHVYVSNSNTIAHSCVPVYAVSDHYPVCITRKNMKQQTSRKEISYRCMNNFNEDAFMADMFNAPWNNVNKPCSPDEALATWSILFQEIVDKHMPVVQKRVKRSMQPKWMNGKLKQQYIPEIF